MGGAFGQHHRIIGGPLMGIGSPRHRAGQWRSRCALERESEDKSLGGSLGKVFYGGGSRFSVPPLGGPAPLSRLRMVVVRVHV